MLKSKINKQNIVVYEIKTKEKKNIKCQWMTISTNDFKGERIEQKQAISITYAYD